MKRYLISLETESLIASATVRATSEAYAWKLASDRLLEMHPELSDEIAEKEPLIRHLGEIETEQSGEILELITRQ